MEERDYVTDLVILLCHAMFPLFVNRRGGSSLAPSVSPVGSIARVFHSGGRSSTSGQK